MFKTSCSKVLIFAGAAALSSTMGAQAAVLAGYDFTGSVATPTEGANVDATDFSNVDVLLQYSTSTAMPAAPSIFLWSNESPDSQDVARYWQFTVAAESGYELDLDGLSLTLGSSDTTNDGTAFTSSLNVRSSVDAFGSDLIFEQGSVATASATADKIVASPSPTTVSDFSIDLSGLDFQGLNSVTFRLYPHVSVTSNQVGLIRLDTIAVTGDSALVPEPSSVALIGLGSAVCLLRRRRA